jgi:hypothetical protein
MFFVLALMLAIAQQRPAHAGIINGTVSLDASGLSGTFELVFIFLDGSGEGDANNTVTLTNFGFGGGSAGAVDPTLLNGGASGDFTTGVTLIDSAFFNTFGETFTAGTQLSFDLGMTTNLESTPDAFAMFLLQSDGTPILSTDPNTGALLLVDIDSAQPTFGLFATEFTPAPIVTFAATAPEPSTAMLLGLALSSALWSMRKRSRDQLRPRHRNGSAVNWARFF